MAARRNRYRRRNRGRFGFLYKLLSVLLILVAILVGCVIFFRVNKIVISGQTRYTQEEIIAASGVEKGDNLFLLDKADLKWDLIRKLPYIDEVVSSRKLPDTLVIEVTECVPVAVLQSGGEYWLMDTKGKLLERGESVLAKDWAEVLGLTPLAPDVGTRLAVSAEEQYKLDQLVALLQALQNRGMENSVTEFVDLTAANEIRFGYEDSLTVIVPMTTDFTGKTYALQRTLEKMEEENIFPAGTLDFTYGDDQAHLLPNRWMP